MKNYEIVIFNNNQQKNHLKTLNKSLIHLVLKVKIMDMG